MVGELKNKYQQKRNMVPPPKIKRVHSNMHRLCSSIEMLATHSKLNKIITNHTKKKKKNKNNQKKQYIRTI